MISIIPDIELESFTYFKKGISLQNPQNTQPNDSKILVRHQQPNGLRVIKYTHHYKQITSITTNPQMLTDDKVEKSTASPLASCSLYLRSVGAKDPQAGKLKVLPKHHTTIFQDDIWILY